MVLWSFPNRTENKFCCSMVPAMFEFDSDNGDQQSVINEVDFTKYQVQYSMEHLDIQMATHKINLMMNIFKIQNKFTIEKMEMYRITRRSRPRMIWQYSGHIDIWNDWTPCWLNCRTVSYSMTRHDSYVGLEMLKENFWLVNESSEIQMGTF